jgi:YVTN family beta-propeller protein
MSASSSLRRVLTCLGIGAAILPAAIEALGAAPAYKIVQKISLGGDGGWDYLELDGTGRLFIARATRVMVVDLASGKLAAEIPDTPGVHGVAFALDLGKGFTSNGRENTVSVFDFKTLQVLSKIKTGENPDAILYDPASRRVFTFNGRSADTTAIDAEKGTVAGTVALGGKPEFAVSDGKGHVFVNIEDKSEIVALDPQKLEVLSRWPLKPCEEPSGLALDEQTGRLFSVCRNKLMAVVDSKTGQVLATPPIGGGVDGAAYDPESHLAFSSDGEGTLTVVGESAPGKFEAVQTLPTEPGARTLALDPKTHRIYTVTAQFGPRPTPTAENPRGRPPVLPGTFELLVAAP